MIRLDSFDRPLVYRREGCPTPRLRLVGPWLVIRPAETPEPVIRRPLPRDPQEASRWAWIVMLAALALNVVFFILVAVKGVFIG